MGELVGRRIMGGRGMRRQRRRDMGLRDMQLKELKDMGPIMLLLVRKIMEPLDMLPRATKLEPKDMRLLPQVLKATDPITPINNQIRAPPMEQVMAPAPPTLAFTEQLPKLARQPGTAPTMLPNRVRANHIDKSVLLGYINNLTLNQLDFSAAYFLIAGFMKSIHYSLVMRGVVITSRLLLT